MRLLIVDLLCRCFGGSGVVCLFGCFGRFLRLLQLHVNVVLVHALADEGAHDKADQQCEDEQRDADRSLCREHDGGEAERGADGIEDRNGLLLVQTEIHELVVKMAAVGVKRALSVQDAAAEREERVR